MDILNFISWIRGGRVVTTVNPAQTLLPVGLKDNRRDDGYLAGAISVEDLVTQLTPTPTYKVFTALLTQSGGDVVDYINWDDDPNTLTIGVTYTITANDDNSNFIPNGAPNNNVGTSFVATSSVVAWGTGNTGDNQVSYNLGAPVATVLENTIGDIWFTYDAIGSYLVNSDGLFLNNKTFCQNSLFSAEDGTGLNMLIPTKPTFSNNYVLIYTTNFPDFPSNDLLFNTPIEIRVYN
jgi:hypothetical protein